MHRNACGEFGGQGFINLNILNRLHGSVDVSINIDVDKVNGKHVQNVLDFILQLRHNVREFDLYNY